MDINKLLEFEQNCKEDLALIESSINEFNIFKVLGVHRREIRHSNFLGWLFDPNESHNLKSRFLIDLLEVVKDSNQDYKPYINELLEKDFKDTIVRRESENNIDVFILNRQLDFVICIENKVDADYSPDQLEKYYNHIETNYKYIKTRFYVTLTPLSSDSHKKFKKGEKFSNITYQDILEKFKKHNDLNNNQDNTIPESIRQSIKQYISMGETEITKTSEIVKKAQTIYTEYKQAIDFIISNQASFLNDKKDVFSYIEKQKLDGFLISHLCGDKNWIYLLPDNEKLLDLFEYKKAKSRGGEYIFSLVINFEKDKVWIKFGFGNIDNPIENEDALTARSEYFKLMKDFDCFKFPDIEMYKYPSADYPEICKLTLFNRNNMEEENIEFLELFIKKFDEINQKIIQPWIDECIEKLPVL